VAPRPQLRFALRPAPSPFPHTSERALREPDEPARELRLLVDHREDLIAERTNIDPAWAPKDRALITMKHLRQTQDRLAELNIVVARIARDLVERIRALTIEINALEADLDERTKTAAPHLREVHGVAAVSAAKFIGEVAGITRFRSRHAFARHNGTAPTPVWSGNTERHRLSRAGNRQLNAAIHRVALTQARSWTDARAYLDRRQEAVRPARKPSGHSNADSPTPSTAPCSPTPKHKRAIKSAPLDIGESGLN
jgi:transposase